MQEKPFDEVTVQQVLDRAGIGRSTFYEHYAGKDDLFLSDVEEFFEMMATTLERRGEKSNRVMPLREMLAHLLDVQPFFRALMASGKVHDVMELGRGHFARGIERRLETLPEGRKIGSLERGLMANAFAGGAVALMFWWTREKRNTTPEEVDEIFHRMVWRGLSGANATNAAKISARGN